jgi:uridine kinase
MRSAFAADDVTRFVDLVGAATPRGAVLLVAVDGRGGSGKSSLATALACARDDVQVVHLDDFYLAPWGELDPRTVRESVLEPLVAGRPVSHRRFDWWVNGPAEWHHVHPRGVVVVEGVFALRPEFRDLYDVTAWVETPFEVCLARGLARDGEGARGLWLAWAEREDRFIEAERPHERANVVVRGARRLPERVLE